MSRTPWDELHSATWNQKLKDEEEKRRLKFKALKPVENEVETELVAKERNYTHELEAIGRRFAFGLVCGGITGATFGFVDVLRDPKAMTLRADVVSKKILRFSAYFGG